MHLLLCCTGKPKTLNLIIFVLRITPYFMTAILLYLLRVKPALPATDPVTKYVTLNSLAKISCRGRWVDYLTNALATWREEITPLKRKPVFIPVPRSFNLTHTHTLSHVSEWGVSKTDPSLRDFVPNFLTDQT
jgi:hypothetical protein